MVNTPGKYTFFVNSSYGGRLRVDGQDLIVDDGSHSPGDSTGSITLAKPTASIELITYGFSGGCEVEFGWIRPNQQFALLTPITSVTPIVRGQLLISEFMADNQSTLTDEDGTASDWLEIWNSTNATVNLGGLFLTDQAAIPNLWALPAWTLGPNQYLIIFASAKDRKPPQAVAGQDNPGTFAQPHLHANFKLSKTGGTLQLNQSDGAGGFLSLSAFNNYPPQNQDVSYGSSDTEGYIGFMEVPSPGNANGATVADFVADTNFDHHRGRYSAAFNLVISTATPGATVRYTTDGSLATMNHGAVYTGPIPISRHHRRSSGRLPTRVEAFQCGHRNVHFCERCRQSDGRDGDGDRLSGYQHQWAEFPVSDEPRQRDFRRWNAPEPQGCTRRRPDRLHDHRCGQSCQSADRDLCESGQARSFLGAPHFPRVHQCRGDL